MAVNEQRNGSKRGKIGTRHETLGQVI